MPTEAIYALVVMMACVVVYVLLLPRMRRAVGLAASRDKAPRPDAQARRLLSPGERSLLGDIRARNASGLVKRVVALREGDWDAREFLVTLLANSLDRPSLDSLGVGKNEQAPHHLLRGGQAIAWAWKARGHGTFDSISKKNLRRFWERLALAEQDLSQAARLDPADPTPWALLIPLVAHLGQPAERGAELYKEAVRRDPECYRARKNYQQYFHARHWGGSYESELEFARQVSAGAPEGSERHLAILEALYTPWHYELYWGDEKAAAAHLRLPYVQQEVRDAYQRSLGSPVHRERRNTIYGRNLAAWWFFMMRDRERTAQELLKIGDAFTEAPWQQLGQPDEQFAAVKAWALRMEEWRVVGWR